MKNIIYVFLAILITSCSPKLFKDKWTTDTSPETFTARFETTKGNFDIYAERKWSPEGVDRLYQLIKHGFYTDIAVFRVVPKFVVQFGIHTDSAVNSSWKKHKISDEPVLQKNDSMTISFARGGAKSRSTQIFINLKNNNRLDKLRSHRVVGYPVIAKVINGMENVHQLYSGYKEAPSRKQSSIYSKGNEYLKRKFPKLDYIKQATILK